MAAEKSKILVVDDSISNLLLIKDILSSNPEYEIICENDSEKVLSQLNNNKIDLLLLDIMMPKIDGYEVCSLIKKDAGFKDIPIIFLTAKIDEPSLMKGFESGGVDYIKKPFLISELLARIKTHIQLKKTTEKLKNELFKHSITQQSLVLSQNELSIRNNISKYFLTDHSDSVYSKLLEEILKYVSMDYGAIGYINPIEGEDDINSKQLICPSIYSGRIESDSANIFSMEDIGDIALVVIKRQPISQKNNVSKLFFTEEEVDCMAAVPIIYQDNLIGIIACAGKNVGNVENSRQKLQNIAGFTSAIIYNRIITEYSTKKIVDSISQTAQQERARFAKDIHDGLGSYLTSLLTYVSILKSTIGSSNTDTLQILHEMESIITDTAAEARDIAHNTLPHIIEHDGLIVRIKLQYDRLFSTTQKTKLNLIYDNYTQPDNLNIVTVAYRIICELMNNTFKYANANNVVISVSTINDNLKISYQDDGEGFNQESVWLKIKDKTTSGLRNIRERVLEINGEYHLNTAPSQGMNLEISLPCK